MNINNYLKEHNLQVIDECDAEEVDGIDEILINEVCINKEGLKLFEYESDILDSIVSEETIHDLFPNFIDFNENKGYLIGWDGKIITD